MVAQCPHKLWLTWDENCRRSSVLKFPAPYGLVVTKFKSRSSKKGNSLYYPLIKILCMKFGWNLMKSVEGVMFQKSWTRKFCKMRRMTPKQTQGIGHKKYHTYVHCSTLSPKFFVRFALRSAIFERLHNLGFPLTPMLKFQSATTF